MVHHGSQPSSASQPGGLGVSLTGPVVPVLGLLRPGQETRRDVGRRCRLVWGGRSSSSCHKVSQGVTGPNGPKLKLQDAFDGTQDTMGERANEPPTGAICS